MSSSATGLRRWKANSRLSPRGSLQKARAPQAHLQTVRRTDDDVRFVPKADMKSFDDAVGDLVAPYRIDTGIPSNRDAKGEHEGRCRAEWHDREMQRQQCHTESGKAGNGVRQYGSRCGTADAAMQDEHDARVDHREHREHTASRRTNSEA